MMNHEKEDAALNSSTLGLSMLPLRKSAPGKVLPNEQRGAGCRSNVLDVSAHGVLGRCVSNGGAKPDVKQRSANASTERMSAQGRPIDCGAVACTQGSQACGGAAKSASLRGCRASLDPALAEHNQRLLRKRGTGRSEERRPPCVQGGFSHSSHSQNFCTVLYCTMVQY